MRALFLMSCSNFKPPTLSQKDRWSSSFNNFVKLALTKNPKKRPTSSQLLMHNFTSDPKIVSSLGLNLYTRSQGVSNFKRAESISNVKDDNTFSGTDCASPGNGGQPTLVVGSCLKALTDNGLAVALHAPDLQCHKTTRCGIPDPNVLWHEDQTKDETITPRVSRVDADSWLFHRIRHLFPVDDVRKIAQRCSENLPSGCLDHLTNEEADHIIKVIARDVMEMDELDGSRRDQGFDKNHVPDPEIMDQIRCHSPSENNDENSMSACSYSNSASVGGFRYGKSTSSGPLIGLPPVPKTHMGACFTKIFNNCPYNVYTAVNWTYPEALGNLIFIGCEEGIFSLDLLNLHDSSLQKISSKRSTWLYVRDNILWSLSAESHPEGSDNGRKIQKPSVSLQDLSRRKKRDVLHSGLDRVLHHRLNKLSNSRGTRLCSVAQCPYSKFLFMVSLSLSKLCLRQYYEPTKQFLLLKIFSVDLAFFPRVFRQLIFRDHTYPLLCLAVTNGPNETPSGIILANLNGDDNILDPAHLNENDSLKSADIIQLQDDRKLVIAYKECVYVATFDYKHPRRVRLIFLLFRLPDPLTKIIALPDSVLTFHCHGMIGKNLKDGQVTQDISDFSRRFTVLNDQGLVILKSETVRSSLQNNRGCDLLLLMGHKNSL